MATHIALLRGINVGGHNKVAMADGTARNWATVTKLLAMCDA